MPGAQSINEREPQRSPVTMEQTSPDLFDVKCVSVVILKKEKDFTRKDSQTPAPIFTECEDKVIKWHPAHQDQ